MELQRQVSFFKEWVTYIGVRHQFTSMVSLHVQVQDDTDTSDDSGHLQHCGLHGQVQDCGELAALLYARRSSDAADMIMSFMQDDAHACVSSLSCFMQVVITIL